MEVALFRNFAVALLMFIILDSIWLGFIIKQRYSKLLSGFKLRKISLLSALIAYIILSFGVSFFVIPRVITSTNAFWFGALFGLIAYGFYHFTNYAIFDEYKGEYLIIDTLWGTIASGITTTLVFLAI